MNVSFNSAAGAYATAAKNTATGTGLEARPSDKGDFSKLVKDAASSAIDSMKAGEAATLQGAAGKADLGNVVTAVSNAEVTLQAAVAVRDKVIQAYMDIIRMPI